MKDLLVYVADGNMAAAVAGLLDRPGVHQAIGCAPFRFDSRSDIKTAAGQNDSGVYTRADELMITSQIFDHAARLRSYEITAEIHKAG
jgi:hypothetical protein